MFQQGQLDLFAQPASPAGEIDCLLAFLAGRPGWTTAKEITAAIGLSDRQIRQLARDHRCSILSGPGSPGYKLIADATLEEITRTADRLRSQAREMLAGSIRLRRVAHQTLR